MKMAFIAIVATGLLGGCNDDGDDVVPSPPPPVSGSNTVILEWNRLLTDAQGAGNLYSFRQYAMLHVAMFDAVNSVTQRYRPYRLQVAGASQVSDEAAAAQAGRDVMVALYPAATATFDAALATRLATLPQSAVTPALDVGKQTAAAVLTWRTGDGSASPDPAYVQPPLPGVWRPTAPGQVAAGGRMSGMLPFALLTPTQYLPAPPPPLDSAEYTQSFDQVRDIGRSDSVVRTAEQTQLARLIAGVNFKPGPFALWNELARGIATSRQLSLTDTARLFALLNVSMHDGLQTSVTSKYVYNLWRPVTAVVNAADDANPATIADAAWTPLLTTPPYPSHASNVACFATAASRSLARALGGDQLAFNANWTWTGAAGAGADVMRPYTTLSQLSHEAGLSRVYGGIHFEFEINAAEVACRKVADYVYDNYMQPR
jgi:hypothetical protein